MNRDLSSTADRKSHDEPQLWGQPLQAPSRSGNDAQETAIMSSIHSMDRNGSRIKRPRRLVAVALDEQEQVEDQQPATTTTSVTPTKGSMTSLSTLTRPSKAIPPLEPVLKAQYLSLDRGAIAPALASPTAPFAKSERKKAYVSAIYYSECFLRKIQPREADAAAFEVQNQYNKWWVNSKASKITNNNGDNPASDRARSCTSDKRRRLESVTTPEDEIVVDSPVVGPCMSRQVVTLVKDRLVEHLHKTGGDTTATEFERCVELLRSAYISASTTNSNRNVLHTMHGTWLTLTKPTYSECLGRNENGEYQYTLGRMSFDMFQPSQLKISIRAVMNNVRVMDPRNKPQSFPRRLAKELHQHRGGKKGKNVANPIRHYDIVVAFTIEANQTRRGETPASTNNETSADETKVQNNNDDFVIPRPIRGLMTNYGYMVADPSCPTRSTIWFSGGSMEVQDEVNDADIWKQIFDESMAPRRDPKSMANVFAAKLLLGAYTTTTTGAANGSTTTTHDEQGWSSGALAPGSSNADCVEDESVPTMSYFFDRPIGGHGEVFCDMLYVDETLRIMRGHHGSIFVFTRVPTFDPPGIETGNETLNLP